VKSDDIILYQYKSIWSLDLNDVDNYTPVKYTTINKDMDYSLSQMLKNRLPSRQRKVIEYLFLRYPEWGRSSVSSSVSATSTEQERAVIQDGWCTDVDAMSTFNDGWQEDRPSKQQKRNDNKE
jgi:hypothetical protein